MAVSCAFAGWLYFELAGNPTYGAVVAKEKVLEFFTGYVLEKSLAVDNIFVFLMIFGYFKVEPQIPTPRLTLWRIRRHRPARHHDLHRRSLGTTI